jgi:WD40 repeat protein
MCRVTALLPPILERFSMVEFRDFRAAATAVVLLAAMARPVPSYAEDDKTAPASAAGNSQDARPAAQPSLRETKLPTLDSLGDPLPAGALLRLGTLRFHSPAIVDDISLSPDEKTIVTAGEHLIAWDSATGQERWRAAAREYGSRWPGAGYGVRGLAFSTDGSRLYTPGKENGVVIWDTLSGHHSVLQIKPTSQPLTGQASLYRAIDVAADGKVIAMGSVRGVVVCSQDGKVLYEVANKPKHELDFDSKDRLTFGGDYSLVRFSPFGRMLAVVTSDAPDVIRLLETETGHELSRCRLTTRLVRMTFSPDGKQIATTERDNAVRLYDVGSGKEVWSHVVQLNNPFENYTSAIVFAPDGKTVAACATDNNIYLLDAAIGNETGRLTGTRWYPWALAFTADSKMLYSSGWDGVVRRWDVVAERQLDLPKGVHATGIVAASPDGRTLAFEDDSGTIRVVDAANGQERRMLKLPGTTFSQLAFSPDSRRLAGGGRPDNKVQVAVWDLKSGEVVHHFDWPKGRDPHSTVESLCFTPSGNRLAAAVFRQSLAYVWDLTTGQRIAQVDHSEIYGLSFSPDGKTLATAGWDSTVRFWDTETGKRQREFNVTQSQKSQANGDDYRMYTVCYSPAAGLIATAHLDGTVRVWQADNMTLRAKFIVDYRFAYGAMSFSPDGLWLATGSAGGNIAVWDPLTGAKVWDLGRHQHYVYTVGFGRDGRTLVSGGEDGVCYLWDLRPAGKQLDKNPAGLDRTRAHPKP